LSSTLARSIMHVAARLLLAGWWRLSKLVSCTQTSLQTSLQLLGPDTSERARASSEFNKRPNWRPLKCCFHQKSKGCVFSEPTLYSSLAPLPTSSEVRGSEPCCLRACSPAPPTSPPLCSSQLPPLYSLLAPPHFSWWFSVWMPSECSAFAFLICPVSRVRVPKPDQTTRRPGDIRTHTNTNTPRHTTAHNVQQHQRPHHIFLLMPSRTPNYLPLLIWFILLIKYRLTYIPSC
jgi:hypothetical protein